MSYTLFYYVLVLQQQSNKMNKEKVGLSPADSGTGEART